MAGRVIDIKGLGEDVCWMLVRQAMGIPDAKMQSDYMLNKVAMLLFFRGSLPERLCVTGAVRQMSGTTIYTEDPGNWREDMDKFQEHLLPIFGYYLDCMYTYGLPISKLAKTEDYVDFPVINAGSPDAHPTHALADMACMLKATHNNMEGASACWIGCDNGTLYSLVECSQWFPFTLRVALSPEVDAAALKRRAAECGARVEFVRTPEEAAEGASFVYAGKRPTLCDASAEPWKITVKIMRMARPGAKLLLSASPPRAIPIAPEILASKASMLIQQAQFRLCIHKRVLHWVFQ